MSTVKVEVSIDPSNQEQRELLDKLLNAISGTSEAPKKVPTTKKETPEIPTKKKPKEEQLKIEDVRAKLAEKVNDHREAIKDKLTELGAKNVTSLATDKYQEFLDFLEEL